MFRRACIVVCFVAGAAALLSAQTAKLTTSWAAPGIGPMSFATKKVVALAISTDMDLRMSAEEAMAREITARGPQGIAAYRAIPKEELASKEKAQQWFTQTGVAGVLTMRVVNVDKTMEYSSVMFGASYYQSFGAYYDYGYGYGSTTVIPLGDPREIRTVAVETLLYDLAGGGRLLWGGMSETTDPKNTGTFVKGLAVTIAKDLEKRGMVSKK
jgi:hypothetical protein